MFVRMISFELQIILLPNLAWWWSTMSQSVMHKKLFAILKVRVTARAHMIKIWYFLIYLLTYWFPGNQTLSDDTSSLASMSYEKIGLLHSRPRSQQRVKMSVFVQMVSSKPPNILLANLVLWCIIMSWTMCKRLVCCFQGQGQSSGSYDQNMTVSTISSELLILLLPNLVWWCFINEPDCLPKRLIFCPQVEGHSEGSYNWNMTF